MNHKFSAPVQPINKLCAPVIIQVRLLQYMEIRYEGLGLVVG